MGHVARARVRDQKVQRLAVMLASELQNAHSVISVVRTNGDRTVWGGHALCETAQGSALRVVLPKHYSREIQPRGE